MKWILSLIIGTTMLSLNSPPIDQALRILRIVESNNNPNATGDNGKAIGIYQIHRAYHHDALEFNPSIGGTYKDCFNPKYAEKVVRAYMDRYCTEARLGRKPTIEDICRIHNGGPYGYRKESTLPFWSKCKWLVKKR